MQLSELRNQLRCPPLLQCAHSDCCWTGFVEAVEETLGPPPDPSKALAVRAFWGQLSVLFLGYVRELLYFT